MLCRGMRVILSVQLPYFLCAKNLFKIEILPHAASFIIYAAVTAF